MSETELSPEDEAPESELDEDDRLKPDFVRSVLDAVEAGDAEEARSKVEPLHPADIADLVELTPADLRPALAAAIADFIDGDVLSEMNDWVRDELIAALQPLLGSITVENMREANYSVDRTDGEKKTPAEAARTLAKASGLE